MLRELERRVAKIEANTDEELASLAAKDCRGVPWRVFTNEELEIMERNFTDAPLLDQIIEAARARHLAEQGRQA